MQPQKAWSAQYVYAVFQVEPTVSLPYAVHLGCFVRRLWARCSVWNREGWEQVNRVSLRLYPDRFGMLPIPLPPPSEQAAIVRFLDHANRRIDRFIRAKKKLIALLNEQKQAIIHRAVTRGLDPNVPMKIRGCPGWGGAGALGCAPAGQTILPLRWPLRVWA